MKYIFTLCAILQFSVSVKAEAACNTRAGFVSNQPAPPSVDQPNVAEVQPAAATVASVLANMASRYDEQTLKLNLASDITSLAGLSGRYTADTPVLGVRMENLPGYDSHRHCNAIQPILYKPKIEHLPDGSTRASVDQGRFSIVFDPQRETRTWLQDADPTGRFFWIFPARFGVVALPGITRSYDAAFSQEAPGSVRRRWIAEAYLNLAFRYYRLHAMNVGWPSGWRPTRADLRLTLLRALGHDCASGDVEATCLASDLIELNEVAPPGNTLARANLMIGDALLENSGISTGVRQLDFGTNNPQAIALARSIFRGVRGMDRLGYVYRRPIRAWDIDTQNRWFASDGPIANASLSRDEVKRILLSSHAAYLSSAVTVWQKRVALLYPDWAPSERTAVAVIGIDLENVSGYRLRLPPEARHVCDILSDATLVGKRSNAGVARDQVRRVRNARLILRRVPAMAEFDWTCLDRKTAPTGVPPSVAIPPDNESTSPSADPRISQ